MQKLWIVPKKAVSSLASGSIPTSAESDMRRRRTARALWPICAAALFV